jgi:S-formylglutathione hydrolase
VTIQQITILALAAALALPAADKDAASTTAVKGKVVRIKVHGAGLEGNLSGDSADPDVTIYLPPSYEKNSKRRYPVVYMLHGFTDSDEKWMGLLPTKHFINLPESIDKTLATGNAKEMIVVMPNAYTRFQGSFYSTSAAVGDWEGFVASELVTYIDSHYRTIAKTESRGIAGHSMGGYGTLRIAMKRPGVYAAAYAMSACCLAPPNPLQGAGGGRGGATPGQPSRAELVQTDADIAKADFGTKAVLASAAAWSANPKNPPLYIDLNTKNGEIQPMVLARWTANAPNAMIDQYAQNLKRLKALAIDTGDKDFLIAGIREMDRLMTLNGVAHTFEVYDGDHINHIRDRVESKVMAFFSQHLSFAEGGRRKP